MKKLLAVILSFAMLMSFATLPVHAAGYATSEKEEILALACQAFPEYVNVIRGEVLAHQNVRTVGEDVELVFSETRAVSDNHYVSLTYYSDGRALMADFTTSITSHSVEEENNGVFYGTISAQYTYNEANFEGAPSINNVTYAFNRTGYDAITGRGTLSTDAHTGYAGSSHYQRDETASSPAYIEYLVNFYPTSGGGTSPQWWLILQIQDNQIEATVRRY